jgi:hypothetical protein
MGSLSLSLAMPHQCIRAESSNLNPSRPAQADSGREANLRVGTGDLSSAIFGDRALRLAKGDPVTDEDQKRESNQD